MIVEELSPRERQIVTLVALGYTQAEAGEMLGISPRTIEGAKRRAMDKLGMSRRHQLVRHVFRAGWLDELRHDPFPDEVIARLTADP